MENGKKLERLKDNRDAGKAKRLQRLMCLCIGESFSFIFQGDDPYVVECGMAETMDREKCLVKLANEYARSKKCGYC